jgi:hypothetical protein
MMHTQHMELAPLVHSRFPKAEISFSRHHPYAGAMDPATRNNKRTATANQASHVLCGVHTTANLPNYQSNAAEGLPHVQVCFYLVLSFTT